MAPANQGRCAAYPIWTLDRAVEALWKNKGKMVSEGLLVALSPLRWETLLLCPATITVTTPLKVQFFYEPVSEPNRQLPRFGSVSRWGSRMRSSAASSRITLDFGRRSWRSRSATPYFWHTWAL